MYKGKYTSLENAIKRLEWSSGGLNGAFAEKESCIRNATVSSAMTNMFILEQLMEMVELNKKMIKQLELGNQRIQKLEKQLELVSLKLK